MTAILCAALALAGGPNPCARGGPVGPDRGGHAIAPTNVEIGEDLASHVGWFGYQWDCLYLLWNRESGWQTSDPNPISQADGIPQANPASKMGPGWEGDAAQQIRWGLGYITARYGTPCDAWAHSNAHGYY